MQYLNRTTLLRAGVALAIAVAAYFTWQSLNDDGLAEGFASGNGRIEAVEIDIAAKTAGRVQEMFVDEGDFVTAGQILVKLDTASLEAQLRQAEAQLNQAVIGVESAKSQVKQREAEKAAAVAVVAQRRAEFDAAQSRLGRTEQLAAKGTASRQALDDDRARFQAAKAAVSAAEAQLAASDAAIATAKSQVVGAEAAVDAGRATIERLDADIEDGTLLAPRDGRIQYRVAQPGEIVAAGGKVLNMIDVSDVYMTFFLPTDAAGRVALGAEVHLVLDAAPQYVIPAKATFVADVAQFTPKTVETLEEREKLMFRVKATIDPDLLRKYIRNVKTGLPGMAYVRLDPRVEWPAELQVKLPQ
ncbi:HlyD family secretion protein [Parvibaculum sp.]|uniref:HlyD family secretion protein n=1 Tax=Parvibaculum sp. TaxID=2024848 RepID=UPI002731E076|nr:HlyD family efflux transporter periplasmic adaptor subunit [Parvibaculum sp.]MDP1627306.1 HlyD family efflux transporter periplasmic adaptor subunit [Parvibaculum sp.]MDP2151961.1 HlyD family efflux transporter periplasmic adaptor subunit [Parvibaculum sp.]MDP3327923.1 HlyD family efflux transporter periplasmic adaptor subunit [Parvibaculum sp.]